MTENVLAGLARKADFARQIGRSERTVSRLEQRGLPVVYIGRTAYVDISAARRWFFEGMPSPKRKAPAGGGRGMSRGRR